MLQPGEGTDKPDPAHGSWALSSKGVTQVQGLLQLLPNERSSTLQPSGKGNPTP